MLPMAVLITLVYLWGLVAQQLSGSIALHCHAHLPTCRRKMLSFHRPATAALFKSKLTSISNRISTENIDLQHRSMNTIMQLIYSTY